MLGFIFVLGVEVMIFVLFYILVLLWGIWGVKGGIVCDIGSSFKWNWWLEDMLFYICLLVEMVLEGDFILMVYEMFDCWCLVNLFV